MALRPHRDHGAHGADVRGAIRAGAPHRLGQVPRRGASHRQRQPPRPPSQHFHAEHRRRDHDLGRAGGGDGADQRRPRARPRPLPLPGLQGLGHELPGRALESRGHDQDQEHRHQPPAGVVPERGLDATRMAFAEHGDSRVGAEAWCGQDVTTHVGNADGGDTLWCGADQEPCVLSKCATPMCASVKRRHRHAACGDSDGGLFQRKTWKAEQASELQFIPAARLKHLDCSSHFLFSLRHTLLCFPVRCLLLCLQRLQLLKDSQVLLLLPLQRLYLLVHCVPD
mmetsp:Transcript_31174/g.74698  ORF Transcript_31174/g.74698 Transcript_31174/m.74698 type:complete len:282 (-) Transcript_31174:539-1384(-)